MNLEYEDIMVHNVNVLCTRAGSFSLYKPTHPEPKEIHFNDDVELV